METTKKFKQLPPHAGVPFTGFKYAEIPGRKAVGKQLRDFIRYCLQEATSPAVGVILGEWGEGKTEAYERYIKSVIRGNNVPYLVSASTVAQSLRKVEADNPLVGFNFLAAVFHAIKHESPSGLIPSSAQFATTDRWLDAVLEAHSKGRVLVFIDEFEELILDPGALRRILSGIKELINGQYKPVAEQGNYPGIISFLLACTPNAYARMQRDPEIAEIFGSWERRVRLISLEPVTRQEGGRFLYDLMRYAYNDNLPAVLPVKDAGVFHTLQTIGRGNLGILVKLFVTVFNAAVIDDDTMRVIDGTEVLNALADETIPVYDSRAKCVERALLERLLEGLDDAEARLLRLLAGELRPFADFEILSRLGLTDIPSTSSLISSLRRKITEKTKVRNVLTSYATLGNGYSFEELRQALAPEIRGNQLQVDGFAKSLEELQDEITFLELQDRQLVTRVFFPWDYRMIANTFEGISLESAHRLEQRLEQIVDQSRLYYRLSDELIIQLFPTPIPYELEFIKDRDLRLKMW